MLKRSRGQYTSQQVKRCAQIGGEFGKTIGKLVAESAGTHMISASQKTPGKYNADIREFVESFRADGLFDVHPGRQHPSFEGFMARKVVKNPEKLGRRLAELSRDFDLWRRIAAARRDAPQ